MSNKNEIQLLSEETLGRVAESLVTRGDLSALSPVDKANFYSHVCSSLGLNPATQPFAVIKLNGREVLYATRGATDQLARLHRLNRAIIEGPEIRDIAGTKIGYAKCLATLPDGRSETAIATAVVSDPVNLFMKLETKAKRRATLSILGLGMLDECELETIPTAQSPESQNTVIPEIEHQTTTREKLSKESAAMQYLDLEPDTFPEGLTELFRRLLQMTDGPASDLKRAIEIERWKRRILACENKAALSEIKIAAREYFANGGQIWISAKAKEELKQLGSWFEQAESTLPDKHEDLVSSTENSGVGEDSSILRDFVSKFIEEKSLLISVAEKRALWDLADSTVIDVVATRLVELSGLKMSRMTAVNKASSVVRKAGK